MEIEKDKALASENGRESTVGDGHNAGFYFPESDQNRAKKNDKADLTPGVGSTLAEPRHEIRVCQFARLNDHVFHPMRGREKIASGRRGSTGRQRQTRSLGGLDTTASRSPGIARTVGSALRPLNSRRARCHGHSLCHECDNEDNDAREFHENRSSQIPSIEVRWSWIEVNPSMQRGSRVFWIDGMVPVCHGVKRRRNFDPSGNFEQFIVLLWRALPAKPVGRGRFGLRQLWRCNPMFWQSRPDSFPRP